MNKNESRFMIQVESPVLGIFDALCDAAHVDRNTGFQCLMLDYFSKQALIKNLIDLPCYEDWRAATSEFIHHYCP